MTDQKKQTQTNEDNIHKNIKRVDHDCKFGDKAILTNNAAYKYETPYNGPSCDNTVLDQMHGHLTMWSNTK